MGEWGNGGMGNEEMGNGEMRKWGMENEKWRMEMGNEVRIRV